MLKSLLPGIPLRTIFRGVTPFIIADFVRLLVLLALPIVSLALPDLMAVRK